MTTRERWLDLYIFGAKAFSGGILLAFALGLMWHAFGQSIATQTMLPPGSGAHTVNVQTLLNLELPDLGYDTLAEADVAALARGRTLVLSQHWPTLTTFAIQSPVRYTGSAQLQAAAPPASLTITGASWVTNVATYTVASASTVIVGMNAFVTGASPGDWNTAGTIIAKTSTSFSVSMQVPPRTYVSGGTAALQHVVTVPCPGSPADWAQTKFFDSSLGGSFGFTDSSCMPNAAWFGAPGNSTGTDELAALIATENSLANSPLGRHTRGGQPEKQGVFYVNATTHTISAYLPLLSGVKGYCLGGYGAFIGTGVPSAPHNCVLALALGVALQGSPEYPMVRTDPDYGGGNSTYGTGLYNFTLDCQSGWYGYGYSLLGNNASCTAWEFYGAQGSGWDDITLRNAGERGIVAPLPTAEVTTALGWTPDTSFPLGATIVDSNFPNHLQMVTTAGTTGHTDPEFCTPMCSWSKIGGTTTSGTAVFTDQHAEQYLANSGLFYAGFIEAIAVQQGPALQVDKATHVELARNMLESVNPLNGYWPGVPPATTVPANTLILDPAGYAQFTVAGGTPGGSIPAFDDTAFGSTTTDGSIVWARKYKAVDADGDIYSALLVNNSSNLLVHSQECEANLGGCIKIQGSTNIEIEQSIMHPVLPAFTPLTSTTSNPIAMGTLTFAVASGQYLQPGMLVSIVADPQDWMVATVTSYSGTSLVVNVPYSGWTAGGGTYFAWNITGGAPNAIIIGAGSKNVTLHNWFSFSQSPNLYVTAVNDRARGIARPGNATDFPTLDYAQNDSQFTAQIETLAINPSGEPLLLAAGLDILAGQSPCGVRGSVQIGGFISNCQTSPIPPTASLIMKGHDAYGWTAFETGLYGGVVGRTRLITAFDALIFQGGLNDANARPVILSAGDYTTGMYPKIQLDTLDGLIFTGLMSNATYSTGVLHSNSLGAFTSSLVVAGDIATTGVSAGTYGDSAHTSQVTVNTKGQVTGAASVAIATATVTAGTGLGGGGAVSPGGTITLTNAAPLNSISPGLACSGGTPHVTGVTASLAAGVITLTVTCGP